MDLIGFANSPAKCSSPSPSPLLFCHVDTCSSDFRLLYPKISADDDPNCSGKLCARGYIFLSFLKEESHLVWRLRGAALNYTPEVSGYVHPPLWHLSRAAACAGAVTTSISSDGLLDPHRVCVLPNKTDRSCSRSQFSPSPHWFYTCSDSSNHFRSMVKE